MNNGWFVPFFTKAEADPVFAVMAAETTFESSRNGKCCKKSVNATNTLINSVKITVVNRININEQCHIQQHTYWYQLQSYFFCLNMGHQPGCESKCEASSSSSSYPKKKKYKVGDGAEDFNGSLCSKSIQIFGFFVWLVVWNIFYFPIYWECHHPNWLSYFSEGWPNHQPAWFFVIFTPIIQKPLRKEEKTHAYSHEKGAISLKEAEGRVFVSFPEIGVPPVIIHFERWDFPWNKPAMWFHFLGTSIYLPVLQIGNDPYY